MVFDGAEYAIEIPNIGGRSNIDVYFVNRHNPGDRLTQSTQRYIYPSTGSTNRTTSRGGGFGFIASLSTSTSIKGTYGSPNLYKNNILISPTTRNDIYTALGQTQNIVNHQGANVSTWLFFNFGHHPASVFNFEGTLQEIVIFDNNLTSDNRQKLHDDINNHYGIF